MFWQTWITVVIGESHNNLSGKGLRVPFTPSHQVVLFSIMLLVCDWQLKGCYRCYFNPENKNPNILGHRVKTTKYKENAVAYK